jgi:hypothetical protein
MSPGGTTLSSAKSSFNLTDTDILALNNKKTHTKSKQSFLYPTSFVLESLGQNLHSII